jgi:glycosyltransferase involved in cell wall biosynthesis
LSVRSRETEEVAILANQIQRLVVIPSDPIAAYEEAGYDYLERYFNPCGIFHEVFALSPLESGCRKAYGMTILGVREKDFGRTLQEVRPDVVRAYGGYQSSDLACRFRIPGIPVVVSVHDTNPSILHRSVRYADTVICMSGAVAACVRARGVELERIRILPNRVDLNTFSPVQDPQRVKEIAKRFPPGKHILHVGRRTEQKNLDTLIRALALLPAEYACVFIGKGDQAPYGKLGKQLGVANRCFWVDAVKNSELPLWYSWCDCMCTPSRWEGFGIVFIEAAACGAVIVTSDIAPMNEYLVGDRSACLVKDFEKPDVLAAGIRRACEDEDYRGHLQAGARDAAAPFDAKRIDEQEVGIYREALAHAANPPPSIRKMEYTCWKAGQEFRSVARRLFPEPALQLCRRLCSR